MAGLNQRVPETGNVPMSNVANVLLGGNLEARPGTDGGERSNLVVHQRRAGATPSRRGHVFGGHVACPQPSVQASARPSYSQGSTPSEAWWGLQAFPGTTVRRPVLPVGAVRSPRLTATRPRGIRLAGFRPAGPARVSRRGARRTVRRHHDPRTDDTRRRASGDHQSGIPSSRWPKARSLILLQPRPRCSTPVIGVSAATAQRWAVGAFP